MVGDPKANPGSTKTPLGLIPFSALIHEAETFKLGADKYGPYNWRDSDGVNYSTYFNAALRHMYQAWDGEDIDPESGAYHVAAARANLAILIDAMVLGKLNDDRPTKGHGTHILNSFQRSREDK